MTMFYFHIRTGNEIVEDEEGSDLVDLAAARDEAIESARGVLAETIRWGGDWADKVFVIADDQGRQLMSMPMTDAMPKGLRR